ncbi:MAG: 4Fe-4S ferredoxin, partial [Gammaproteobacteria bacterium HGW-Gammaproteobacteria-9]
KIKRLLDPTGILNPDVVLSEDPDIHLKNLKPMPAADEIVDKCIECGFCEPVCPSNGLTLTPRQRIVIWRDIQARKRAGVDTTEIERLYHYHGVETCAATGLCAQRCPVGINTGDLVRKLRGREASKTGAANWLADHFATAVQGTRFMLHAANGAHIILGTKRLAKLSATMTNASKGRVPQWTPATPQPLQRLHLPKPTAQDERPRVVYLAACVSRAMAPAARDQEQEPLLDKTRSLLDQEMLDALLKASRGGLDPIYCDTSPCTLRLVQGLTDQRLDMYDPVRFIRTHLLDKLDFVPQEKAIAVHVTCSTQHLGEAQALIDIARRCAKEVVVPEGIHCCGFAGDKGFTTPELNSHALRSLKDAVQICDEGISTSRTCEIGLSRHGEIDYHGLVYLVDRVTRSKTATPTL